MEAQRGEGTRNRICTPSLGGPGATCCFVKDPCAALGVQYLSGKSALGLDVWMHQCQKNNSSRQRLDESWVELPSFLRFANLRDQLTRVSGPSGLTRVFWDLI